VEDEEIKKAGLALPISYEQATALINKGEPKRNPFSIIDDEANWARAERESWAVIWPRRCADWKSPRGLDVRVAGTAYANLIATVLETLLGRREGFLHGWDGD